MSQVTFVVYVVSAGASAATVRYHQDISTLVESAKTSTMPTGIKVLMVTDPQSLLVNYIHKLVEISTKSGALGFYEEVTSASDHTP